MDMGCLCPGCMNKISEQQMQSGCPYCGYRCASESELPPHILKPGTILNGKYMIVRKLAEGGCGITYLGYDLNLEIKTAIKEYYPVGFVARDTGQGNDVIPGEGDKGTFFEEGKKKVIHEARILAKLSELKGIVSVRDYFEGNHTSYIIMEYLDGETLKSYLARMGGRLPLPTVMNMMRPVLESLNEVHKHGMIHRDISPDNIMILKNGSMKLLDFGSARDMMNDMDRSTSVMLKPGYAPEEQYRIYGVQGTWTDVYAVCATLYKCLTGVTPVDAMTRMRQDSLLPPSRYGVIINPAQEEALLRGMAVYAQQRIRTINEFYQAFYFNTMPVMQPVAQSVMPPMTQSVMQPVAQYGVPNPQTQGKQPGSAFGMNPYDRYRLQPRKKSKGLVAAVAVTAALALVLIALFLFVREWDRRNGSSSDKQAQGNLARDESQILSVLGGGQQNLGTEEEQFTQNGLVGEEAGMRGSAQGMRDNAAHGIPTLCCDMPEGFIELGDGMYYAPGYPNDTANINIMTSEHDTITFQYTKESYCDAVKNLYDQRFGLKVDITCSEFTRTTINGCKALIVRISYSIDNMEIVQIQCSVETEKDKVTTFTFTQLADGNWTDEFDKSLDTMRVEYR